MIDFFIFSYIIIALIGILSIAMVFTKKREFIFAYLFLMSMLASVELIILKAYSIAIVEIIISMVFIPLLAALLFKGEGKL